jgi:hypothetical protein
MFADRRWGLVDASAEAWEEVDSSLAGREDAAWLGRL